MKTIYGVIAAATTALILAAGYVGIGYHSSKRSGIEENQRIRGVLTSNYPQLEVPGDVLVYQELDASRKCKKGKMDRLVVSPLTPAQICQTISALLRREGWDTFSGCRQMSYPHKRAPIDGDRPTYSYSLLDASKRQPNMYVTLQAVPAEAWGYLAYRGLLSEYGDMEAIPLARRSGMNFYSVSLSYMEDRALFEKWCPPDREQCDCGNSLVERSFTPQFGGRHFRFEN